MKNPFEVYTDLRKKSRGQELSWEESALDSASLVEGFSSADTTRPKLFWVPVVVVFVLIILGGQLFRLQIIQPSYLLPIT